MNLFTPSGPHQKLDKPTGFMLLICAVVSLYLMAMINGVMSVEGFSWNPLRAAPLCFSSLTSTIMWALLFFFLFTLLLYIRAYGLTPVSNLEDERNFHFSQSGIYGTAGWLKFEELKGVAKICRSEKAGGPILGQLDQSGQKVVSVDPASYHNRHIAVCGGSGSRKSRSFARPQIMQSVKRRESVIVTDPKGELFESTAQYMRDNGYIVRSLNLKKPLKSDSWNCLRELRGSTDRAQLFAHVIVENTASPKDIWKDAKRTLLKALALRVERGKDFPDEAKNMRSLYSLIASGEFALSLRFAEEMLEEYDCQCAAQPYALFEGNSPNSRANIITSLGNALELFQGEEICKMTDKDEIDLTLPSKQPCAYYCIMPDQNSSKDFLATLFFSFLFEDLCDYVDEVGPENAIPVNFILDEFPNIGEIPDFSKKIATVRSRNLNIAVIFQSIVQLQERYPAQWATIVGNCDTVVFLGGGYDIDNAKFFAARTGDATVKVRTDQHEKLASVASISNKHSTGDGKRTLMTPDEVMRLNDDKCLIIFKGCNVMQAYKFDYTQHPEAGKLTFVPIRSLPDLTDEVGRAAMRDAEQESVEYWQTRRQYDKSLDDDEDDDLTADIAAMTESINPFTPLVSVGKDIVYLIKRAHARRAWSVCDPEDTPFAYIEAAGAGVPRLTDPAEAGRWVGVQDGLVVDMSTGEVIGRMEGSRMVPLENAELDDGDVIEVQEYEDFPDERPAGETQPAADPIAEPASEPSPEASAADAAYRSPEGEQSAGQPACETPSTFEKSRESLADTQPPVREEVAAGDGKTKTSAPEKPTDALDQSKAHDIESLMTHLLSDVKDSQKPRKPKTDLSDFCQR